MAIANIGDRQSIERIYPREVWETEAGMNSEGGEQKLCGLLIESNPDGDGSFQIRRAARDKAENEADSYVIFLCPYMGRAFDIFTSTGVYGAVVEKHDALEDDSYEYADFIDGVIAAARTATLHHILGIGDNLPKG